MEKEKEALPDEVLVVAAILGDLEAFDELVRRYRRAVLRLAESVAGVEGAEDIAQDAWLLAFKSLPSIDDPRKFASWLMVIAKHRALRVRKSASQRKNMQMPLDEFLLEKFSAIHGSGEKAFEEGESVRMALDLIPVEYNMVIKMRFYDGISLKKISAFLDLPLSTVKWRIYRGKALLQEKIEQITESEGAWKNR